MKKYQVLAVAFVALLFSEISWTHQRGVSEISEGTIRTVYIKKPLIGAQGYVHDFRIREGYIWPA